MSLEQTACDDLKAFERRLTEVVGCLQPATLRWRILLAVVSVSTAMAAWHWLTDPMTPVVSLTQSFCNHPFLTKILLAVVSVSTAMAAWHWLTDPMTPVVSLTQSLCNHPFFTFTSTLLVLLFLMGVHRKVIAPSIITARTRSVLNDFNMSCDETGKLILKPRPANNSRGCIDMHL